MAKRWTTADIPVQNERTFVVTGANSGIGYEAALELATKGGHVIVASRNPDKAEDAATRMRNAYPEASLEILALDLADLGSVRSFAEAFKQSHSRLDVLVNNAGVMAIPRRTTADGFEMQLGTNHLGHFALTGLLLDRLIATASSRVVTVSSTMHRAGRIHFDDLQGERSYGKWPAYGQSKLANLLFAYELRRRLEAGGHSVASLACHPGYAATNLQSVGPKMQKSTVMRSILRIGNTLFAQSAAMGALPTLYAATSPDAVAGDYIGPAGITQNWGHPTKVRSNARSYDEQVAARLWAVSEQLTGVRYDLPSPRESP